MHQPWPAVQAAAPDFAVLPIGAIEQHGPHLPVSTDLIIAETIAARFVARYGGLLAPAIPMSCSHEHADFFELSITFDTLDSIIWDVLDAAERHGMSGLVLINAHGGNHVLASVAQEANVDEPRILLLPQREHWRTARESAGLTSSSTDDMHAGELETSIMLAVRPDLVDMSNADDVVAPDRSRLHLEGMSAYTESGVIGAPTLATAEKGEAVLAALIDGVAEDVAAFMAPSDDDKDDDHD